VKEWSQLPKIGAVKSVTCSGMAVAPVGHARNFRSRGRARSGIHDLNQVTVPSTDVRRSIDFYQCLRPMLIVENFPGYARFECPEGDATFSVHQTNQPSGSPGVVAYFECEDLDSTVVRVMERGLRFEAESQDHPWLWREAFLKDSDGSAVCLFRAGENRKNPPWRLKRN
jgi:predicted enzyme related to lactoylglutathione lyase